MSKNNIEVIRKAVKKMKQTKVEDGTVVRFRVQFTKGGIKYRYTAFYLNFGTRAGWFVSGSADRSISGLKTHDAFMRLLANEHGREYTVSDAQVATEWESV